jgi:hypothetical protein
MDSVQDNEAGPSEPEFTTRDWDVNSLVDTHKNFRHAPRISADISVNELLAKIEEHERSGVPLVIENYHTLASWPNDMFSVEWLRRYAEQQGAYRQICCMFLSLVDRLVINVRDVHSRKDLQMPLFEFLSELESMSAHVQLGESRRLYGKDYECPRDWSQWLDHSETLPNVLLPNGTNNALRNLPDPVSALR